MAVIQCAECERKIKVPDGSAGRKVRCPHCKAVTAVPPTEEFFEEPPKSRSPPPPARSVQDDDEERPRLERRSRRFDEHDDDVDDRPRQRRQHQDDRPAKSGRGLVIGLCVGLGALLIGGGALAFILMGREPAVDARTQMDLKMIGLAYHNHLEAFRKPPARAEDLRAFLAESPTAFQRLKDGQVMFSWNVGVQEMAAGSSNTILAYDKDVPAKGGLVLFGDGMVRVISLDEFQKTATAQPRAIPVNPPPVASGWKEYTSKSGTYTILLPEAGSSPNEQALTVNRDGGSLPTFSLQVTLPDKSVYQVILTQFPPKFIADSPRAALLRQFRDAVVSNLGGQITEESNLIVANEPAVSMTFKAPGPGKGYGRVFIVNNSLYQMLVLGPENSPYCKEVGKFFDSFKLRAKDKAIVTPPDSPKINIKIKIPEPPNARVGVKLAQQYVNAKKYAEAALMFEKTAPLDPKLRAWHFKEAAVYWIKSQNKEKALAAAKAAIASEPEKRSPLIVHFWHRGLGEVFLETAQYALAIEHLEKAIQNTDIDGYIMDCRKLLEQARMKSSK